MQNHKNNQTEANGLCFYLEQTQIILTKHFNRCTSVTSLFNHHIMKHFIFGCFLLLFTQITLGQDWLTDFNEAKLKATNEHKPIILVFQGSDWCAPCMKLDQDIWRTQTFKDYAQSHFVLLKADFPRKKKNSLTATQQQHNNALAEKYNPNGFFPYVLVLDEKGQVKGRTGYKKTSPNDFIKLLESY